MEHLVYVLWRDPTVPQARFEQRLLEQAPARLADSDTVMASGARFLGFDRLDGVPTSHQAVGEP